MESREKTVDDLINKYDIEYFNNLNKLDQDSMNWFKENMKQCNVKAIHIDQYQIIFKGRYNKVIKTIKNN